MLFQIPALTTVAVSQSHSRNDAMRIEITFHRRPWLNCSFQNMIEPLPNHQAWCKSKRLHRVFCYHYISTKTSIISWMIYIHDMTRGFNNHIHSICDCMVIFGLFSMELKFSAWICNYTYNNKYWSNTHHSLKLPKLSGWTFYHMYVNVMTISNKHPGAFNIPSKLVYVTYHGFWIIL